MQRAGAGCRGENQLGIANISVSWVSGAGGAVQGYIGFYPGNDAIREFQEELASYKCTKTAIHLPLHEKLPLALIRRRLIFCKEYNETHD